MDNFQTGWQFFRFFRGRVFDTILATGALIASAPMRNSQALKKCLWLLPFNPRP